MEYSYEWKDDTGRLHRIVFGPYVSSCIRQAAEEDAIEYGIDVDTAVTIIMNGMCAKDMAVEEFIRTGEVV